MRTYLLGMILVCCGSLPAIAFATTCDAANFQQLSACVQTGNTVRLTADIVLDVGQKLLVQNISDVLIDGANPNGGRYAIDETPSRFAQDDPQGGFYIQVSGTNKITIQNIAFRSTPAQDADYCAYPNPGHGKAYCWGAVLVSDSSDINISGNQFTARKKFQLQLAGSHGVVVDRNDFSGAATYGVWTGDGASQSNQVMIINNNFSLAGANGVMLSAAKSAWIGNNTFTNNHRLAQYFGFGGGQVVLEESSVFDLEDVSVTGNTFQTSLKTYANGIEFANFDKGRALRNVQIKFNRIENSPEHAIVFDASNDSSRLESVSISDNEFVNNREFYLSQVIAKAFTGIALGNNYTESAGAQAIASFDGTPTTCAIPVGGVSCTVNIKWNVVLVRGGKFVVKVRDVGSQVGTKVGRGHFASGIDRSGSQDAPWVGRGGSIFELYFEADYEKPEGWEAPIASILVKGV